MTDPYIRDLLRMSVAQICQTIGYNSTQTTPLELLQDVLHKFLQEFARDLRRQTEHYNRTEANLNDTVATLNRLDVNVNELVDYICNVEPVAFAVDTPKFPARKDSSLNFLKPGSKEVLTRPVHIYEHLPPILPPEPTSTPASPIVTQLATNCENLDKQSTSTLGVPTDVASDEGEVVVISENCTGADALASGNIIEKIVAAKNEPNTDGVDFARSTDNKNEATGRECMSSFLKGISIFSTAGSHLDEGGKPTREISSVVMTTGGFISPAIEGKLPDAIIPNLIEKLQGLDAPPPPVSLSRPASHDENSRSDTVYVNTKVDEEHEPSTQLQTKVIQSKNKKSAEANYASGSQSIEDLNPSEENGSKSTNLNSSTLKKFTALQNATTHSSQAPNQVATKLLKKAKKKPLNVLGKLNRNDPQAGVSPLVRSNVGADINEKAYRKRMKMLQKLTKSSKFDSCDVGSFIKSDGKFKGILNPTLIAAMPHGPERQQMEKMLKKQNKQKQKALKQNKLTGNTKKVNQPKMIPSDGVSPDPNLLSEQPNKTGRSTLTLKDIKVPSTGNDGNAPSLIIPQSKKIHQSSAASHSSSDATLVHRNIKPTDVSVRPVTEMPLHSDVNLLDKKASVEIKLSTEPDRSKLNIFKKISKQKCPKALPPSMSNTPATSSSENPVINLPSGTTITPAPLASARHDYTPDNARIINVEQLGEKPICGDDRALSHTDISLSAAPFFISLDRPNEATPIVNKPKKRGRKPGSKNQAKIVAAIQPQVNKSPNLLKKSKKSKTDKYADASYVVPSELLPEPLNLTNPNQIEEAKERKERKKTKSKMPAFVTTSSDISAITESFNVPTKEEVSSINKKLRKMDTVLQPAPPLLTSWSTPTDLSKAAKEMSKNPLHSLTKQTAATKSSGVKKRSQQQQQLFLPSVLQPSLPPTMQPMYPFNTRPSSISPNKSPLISGVPRFPNMSMLPLYPFAARPGLIPTPGLFPPPGLDASSSMLLPVLLPFPNLKSSTTGKLCNPDAEINENKDESEFLLQAGDRSYCNVAPLVPESMKLTPPNSTVDSIKVSKLRQSPKPNDILFNTSLKNLEKINIPDSNSGKTQSSMNSIGMLAHKEGNFTERSTTIIDAAMMAEASNLNKIFHQNQLPSKMSIGSGITNTPSAINPDDPIEVSDDSDDQPPKVILDSTYQTIKGNQGFIKPPALISPISTAADESFTQSMNIPVTESGKMHREAKKLKKSYKMAKRNITFNSSAGLSKMSLDIFSSEKPGGVGKLAGGADLIPLTGSGTGLAYSSKTIPSTSLTASTAPSFQVHKRDHTSNIFENLSFAPSALNIETPKKRKEHKKLKKVKDGKIKKKKDKKEKSKNKDRSEISNAKIDSTSKEKHSDKYKEKDILKKLKKEKKKEKQREAMDTESALTASYVSKQGFGHSPNVFETNIEKIPIVSVLSPTSGTAVTSSLTSGTVSPIVPKITLRLGSCQSPSPVESSLQRFTHNPSSTLSCERERDKKESSPELARISPLVTRPPKQKSGVSSTPTASNADTLGEIPVIPSGASGAPHTVIPTPPSPWQSGATLTASSVLLPQQLSQTTQAEESAKLIAMGHTAEAATACSSNRPPSDRQSPVSLISETSRPSSYIDAEGNRVWICPACGKVDDGSAMIGCDGCDAWYHWVCVGIFVAPKDNEDWFCRVCITRKKGLHGSDKKRKRSKKK